VQHATQGLNKRGSLKRHFGGEGHKVRSRHRDVIPERPGQAGDSEFIAEGTLVGITRLAILAPWLPAEAPAIEDLIDHHGVSCADLLDVATDRSHSATELVPENLRLLSQGNRLAALVDMVVGPALEDVEIRATDARCTHAN
jgi:hypothetical protein